MTDKEKIRKEVQRRFEQIKNSIKESDSGAFYQLKELLEFINSLQEEPVSIWHDASEKPEREDLLIETNDGRIIHRQSINNYGMVKRWAYTSDLLNLDNSCNFGKNLQEKPISDDLEEASVDYAATGEFLDNGKEMIDFQKEKSFKAGARWQKNQLPKWEKRPTGGCWSGEIAVHPSARLFRYEHYVINADKLFELLSKEK